MSALSRIQKEAFLKRINELPFEVIMKKIDADELSVAECIENGLEKSNVERISAVIRAREEEERIQEENQVFYEQINNDEKIIDQIQDAIRTGEVTEEGLLENTHINQRLLQAIIGYSQAPNSPENNSVPLAPGTDIFFFGKSGSGKTCVLASIFNYAEEQGLFMDNPISIKGINYKNILVNELNNGTLPKATPATQEAVTYISTTLIEPDAEGNPSKEESPLNFVEMSGEFFSLAAKDPDSFKDSIDAHGYLSGSNKKLLFFVVDYDIYSQGNNKKSQSQEFQLIISHLDKYKKALRNTLSICIIVNKSDKFPKDVVDKNSFATEFFQNNFKSVYLNLKKKQEKYKFDLRCHPFSVGDFLFKNSYLSAINQEYPKDLIHYIGKHSSYGRGRTWGIFESLD